MAEYDPYSDLNRFAANLTGRERVANASSLQADKGALMFGLQNLEGNQAMQQQRLKNEGGYEQELVKQGFVRGMTPDLIRSLAVLAKRANIFQDVGTGLNQASDAGVSMPMGTKLDDLTQALNEAFIQGDSDVVKAARASADVERTEGNKKVINSVQTPGGTKLGSTQNVTEEQSDQTRGGQKNTPLARDKSTQMLQGGQSGAQPNAAQQWLDAHKAAGRVPPNAELTGQMHNGKPLVRVPGQGIGVIE